MKKQILLVLILSFFFFSTPTDAITTADTGWLSPTGCSGWANCNNAYVDDGTSATTTGSSTVNYYDFGFNSIPTNATITKIEIKTEASVSNQTGTVVNLIFDETWDNFTSFSNYPNLCASDFTDRAPPVSGTKLPTSLTSYTLYSSGVTCQSHSWTLSDLENGNFGVKITPNASDFTGKTWSIDVVQVKVTYEYQETSADITDVIINDSTGQAYVDIEGYINYQCSEDLECFTRVYANCTAVSKAPILNQLVFQGKVNEYDTNFCSPDDQNYAVTATFQVEPDYNCSYEAVLFCTENGQTVVNTSLDLGEPSELNTLPIPDADDDNPFGWLSNQFRIILSSLFSLNITAYSEWQNTKFLLQQKVPFAYITPIFDLEFTNTDETTIELGVIDFDLPAFDLEFDLDFTSLYSGFFLPIKTTLTYLMWFSFFIYLVFWFKNHHVQ